MKQFAGISVSDVVLNDISVKAVQSRKQLVPIVDIFDGIVIKVKDVLFAKASLPMVTTLVGIVISLNPVLSKQFAGIKVSDEPESNVNDVKLVQFWKQLLTIDVTPDGIITKFKVVLFPKETSIEVIFDDKITSFGIIVGKVSNTPSVPTSNPTFSNISVVYPTSVISSNVKFCKNSLYGTCIEDTSIIPVDVSDEPLPETFNDP